MTETVVMALPLKDAGWLFAFTVLAIGLAIRPGSFCCSITIERFGAAAIFFSINPTNGFAIFDQIVRQVKFAVASGTLNPGEMVPSVRELARELSVNPNTVVKVYRDLTSEGILKTVRGTGLSVAKDAVAHCEKERLALLCERIRHVLEEAHSSRLETGEIRSRVEDELVRLERAAKSKRGKKGSGRMSAVFGWNQVTKLFGRQTALSRFTLSSESGSVVALLGDNGAGKTTAIRILLGLLEPTSGKSHVFGLDSQTHGPAIRQRVGYVPAGRASSSHWGIASRN